MIGLRTFVLQNSYMPISLIPVHTIPVEDAVTRVCNGTCHVVSEYDQEIKTQHAHMKWPSVIARNESFHHKPIVKLRPETLFYRDHGICVYCEKKLTVSEVTYDHYIPKRKGGERTWENIVSACSKCNSLKGHSDPVGEWEPKYKPYRPDYFKLLNVRKRFPIVLDHESWVDFLPKWENEVILRT